MSKIYKVVLRETAYIAAWTMIFSSLLQAVFLIFGIWDMTVLLGNLYGDVAVLLNFLLMGLTIQKAVTKEPGEVKNYIKASSTLRMLMLFVLAIVGALLPCFNTVAVLIPLIFPRVAIMLRPFVDKGYKEELMAGAMAARATDDADASAVEENGEAAEDDAEKGGEDDE